MRTIPIAHTFHNKKQQKDWPSMEKAYYGDRKQLASLINGLRVIFTKIRSGASYGETLINSTTNKNASVCQGS